MQVTGLCELRSPISNKCYQGGYEGGMRSKGMKRTKKCARAWPIPIQLAMLPAAMSRSLYLSQLCLCVCKWEGSIHHSPSPTSKVPGSLEHLAWPLHFIDENTITDENVKVVLPVVKTTKLVRVRATTRSRSSNPWTSTLMLWCRSQVWPNRGGEMGCVCTNLSPLQDSLTITLMLIISWHSICLLSTR